MWKYMASHDWLSAEDSGFGNDTFDAFNSSDSDSSFNFESDDQFSFGDFSENEHQDDLFAQKRKPAFSHLDDGFESSFQNSGSSESGGWGSFGEDFSQRATPSSSDSGWDSFAQDDDWGTSSDWGQSGTSRRRGGKKMPVLILCVLALVIGGIILSNRDSDPAPPVIQTTPTVPDNEPEDVTQPPVVIPQITVPVITEPDVIDPPVTIPPETEPVYVEPPLVEPITNVSFYCRSLLPPNQQEIYDRVCYAVARMQTDPIVFDVSENVATNILRAVTIDHPEFYWFGGIGTYYFFYDNPKHITEVVLTYDYSREQVLTDLPIIEAYAQDCLRGLENLSQYDQVKAVYEYIINHTFYDLDYYGQDMREIIINRRGVCTSYAETTQYLLQRLGIEAFVITGGNHAWNIVKVEGQYYQLDTTWGDPVVDRLEDSQLNYNYFLVTTDEMFRDHTLESTFPIPDCTATACNYFVREGRRFDVYDRDRLINLMRQDAAAGQKTILRCGNRQVYDTILNILKDGGKIYPMLEELAVTGLLTDDFSYGGNDTFLIITFHYKYA